MRLILSQNLRTNQEQSRPQHQKQSLKFSIKVVNKTAASAAKLAKCILLHSYLRNMDVDSGGRGAVTPGFSYMVKI